VTVDRIERILVYGVTGSGKTTLAQRIGAATGLPFHLVDELTWEPGWVQVDPAEQRRRVDAICSQDRWVLDTAYTTWLEVPLARAQLIVALDYPRWISLSRLLRRTAARLLDRRPICNGNVETLRTALSRDSIITWHFRSLARKRRRIREWQAAGRPVLRFTRPRQAARWLAQLDRAGVGADLRFGDLDTHNAA
jgi:adenylate kinase family enzyme